MTIQHKLAKLLKQTADAHHKAFLKTDGEDKDWPEWYAKYLLDSGVDELFQEKKE